MKATPARGIAVAMFVFLALATTVAAQEPGVELSIADWYPQGNDYVFVCEAMDFTATSYDWTFGDGASLEGVSNNDVYHTFAADGTYTVSCTAHADGMSYTDEMMVTVGEAPPPGDTSVDLYVDEWYPQGNDYVFHCDADGYTASTYDWFFGDGSKLLSTTHDSVYHTYGADGTYTVKCVANSDAVTEQDTLQVTVGETPPPAELDLDLFVADWYPQGNDYVFVCEADGWTPTDYEWWFGDGEKLLDQETDNVYHTFDSAGTYEVMCQASNSEHTMSETLMVTVGDVPPPVDGNETPTTDAVLSIADWFPQGPNYVFVCEDMGFDATHYDFTFGDGESLHNLTRNNVYHTYAANGAYDPTCTARNGEVSASGSLLVFVDYYNETDNETNGTVEPNVDADFTGLNGLIAGARNSFGVSVYNVSGVEEMFRYQGTILENGTPVVNQSLFYPAEGDDEGNSSDWTEVVTDADGAFVWGPVNGTSVALEPALSGMVGVTTPFEADMEMGDYTLTVALVDPVTEDEIVADDPYDFSVVALI